MPDVLTALGSAVAGVLLVGLLLVGVVGVLLPVAACVAYAVAEALGLHPRAGGREESDD